MALDSKVNGDVLDDVDRRLLDELQADARIGYSELSRRVNLSAPAVAQRVSRLERAGVITGYHARVDPRRIGLSLTAVIRIRPAPGQIRNVAELAARAEEVVECHRITGEDCFIAFAHVRDVEHLEVLIDRFVALGQTTTSILQSSPVTRRAIDVGRMSEARTG